MSQINVSPVFTSEELSAEIVVVGAGVAGICAAVAAARCGVKTLLVTDRPVLGGSASVEVGVGMNGAAYSPFNLWGRETGIAEEIRNGHAACWSGASDSYWTAMDRVYLDLVMGEPNLRLLLNTTVLAAQCENDKSIRTIYGVQLRAEKTYTLTARYFIDCSGDGTLGALAGADARQGREARAEFNESLAPEVADSHTMGTTLLWRSRQAPGPVPYVAPHWAIDVSQLPALARPGSDPTRDVGPTCVGAFHGLWWAEFGGQIDTLHDDQQVLLHTRALVYGIWDWIKNSGKVTNVADQELVQVATLGGKRESRRLMGPVVLTENHWRGQSHFDDAVAYTGWPIDVHPPRGYLDDQPACTHVWLPGVSDIPLRSLYSRNVPNLLFAGRCFSTTHIGLGSPRVIATTAACGQAAGAAAALCLKANCPPGLLAPEHIAQIQQRLLRLDQGIVGLSLQEDDDLARSATITASSTRTFEQLQGEHLLALDPAAPPAMDFGTGKGDWIDHTHNQWFTGSAGAVVAIAADQALEYVDLKFQADSPREAHGLLYLADRAENYRLHTQVGELHAKLGADGWARFAIAAAPNESKKYLLHFPPQKGLALCLATSIMPGVMVARVWDRPGEPLAEHEFSRTVGTPCFRVGPAQNAFAPANVADGYIRPHGLPHLWCSGLMESGAPQTIALDWPAPVEFSRVELVFDTQLNAEPKGIAQCLTRHYELLAYKDQQPVTIASETNNHRRLMTHVFGPVRTKRLELNIHATHGSPYAGVYAIRIYP